MNDDKIIINNSIISNKRNNVISYLYWHKYPRLCSPQARLVVSLTTLLVLYTLFSQASSSLPNTAYIKLIDIWFFFCICTLFFIILFHVFSEYLPERRTNVVRAAETDMYTDKRLPTYWFTAETATALVRTFLIPGGTVIFLGVYWYELTRSWGPGTGALRKHLGLQVSLVSWNSICPSDVVEFHRLWRYPWNIRYIFSDEKERKRSRVLVLWSLFAWESNLYLERVEKSANKIDLHYQYNVF